MASGGHAEACWHVDGRFTSRPRELGVRRRGLGVRVGTQDDTESVATIRGALEHGINWIDTAPSYGSGHAEAVIGRALRDVPSSDRPWIFSKCGLASTRRGKVRLDLTPARIRKDVAESRRRLGVEALDLCHIHWPAYPRGAKHLVSSARGRPSSY